ncbi:hypothetical protein D3C79_915360 [compost metagenome]
MAGDQSERVDLATAEEKAGGGLGQQTAVGRTEHRGLYPLLAVGQHRVRHPHLQRSARSAVFVFWVPIVGDTQQARLADTATATVELYAQVGMGIDTDANQALGEAGL